MLETPVILSRDGEKWTAVLEKGVPFENRKGNVALPEMDLKRKPAFAAYGNAPRKPGDVRDADLAAFSPELFGESAGVDGVDGTFKVEFVETKESKGMPRVRLKLALEMPSSIHDLDRISVTPFEDFIDEVRELENYMEKWEEEMKLRVATRKRWQFWIPRQWPP